MSSFLKPGQKNSKQQCQRQKKVYGITPIKFDHEPVPIVHNSPYLTPGFKRIAIVGQSGSGKTHLLGELMPMMADPGFLIVYCRTLEQPKYQQIMEHYRNIGTHVVASKNPPDWYKLINTLRYFNSKGEEVHPEFEADGKMKPWKPERDPKTGKVILDAPIARTQGELLKTKKHNIIVIDDQSAKVMGSENLAPYILTSRHFNCSVILIYQRFVSIIKTVRENLNGIILYKTLDGYKYLRQSIGGIFDNEEDFKEVMKLLEEHKFNYIYIDLDTDCPALRVRFKFGGLLAKYRAALEPIAQ